MKRIEIVGNIASGKTTLARWLAQEKYFLVEEKFYQHPFLQDFYANPHGFAFETEIVFLLQHYHDIKKALEQDMVCDYSLYLDRAYASVTLALERQLIFSTIAENLEAEINSPSTVVYLTCPENILLERIRNRKRSFELSIDSNYLKRISKAVADIIDQLPGSTNLITIDSHKYNFVSGIDHIVQLSKLF